MFQPYEVFSQQLKEGKLWAWEKCLHQGFYLWVSGIAIRTLLEKHKFCVVGTTQHSEMRKFAIELVLISDLSSTVGYEGLIVLIFSGKTGIRSHVTCSKSQHLSGGVWIKM